MPADRRAKKAAPCLELLEGRIAPGGFGRVEVQDFHFTMPIARRASGYDPTGETGIASADATASRLAGDSPIAVSLRAASPTRNRVSSNSSMIR
jgi:hypothetical protein